MNKKAVSAVIATLLLVVITIIATIVVWQFVKVQIIEKNIEASSCFDYRDYVRVIDSEFTCYNENETKINIERSTEEKTIEGISITISSGASSKSYDLKNNINITGVAMYSGENIIIIPNKGESETYVFSGISGNLASITVIINGKSCDSIRQNYNIESC
jgi:flagellin-like protein